MKSLEIVNSVIRVCKAEDTAIGLLYIEGLEQIKQDLEVSEIIRKKRVDILALECRINAFKDDNERILHSYNAMFYNKKIYKLTMEELLKLKQWLEAQDERE